MLKKELGKACSILERINKENHEEEYKNKKEDKIVKEIAQLFFKNYTNANSTNNNLLHSNSPHTKENNKFNTYLINKHDNNKINTTKINAFELNNLINNPNLYIHLIINLFIIKQKYPYELKVLKYFLTSHKPIEERLILSFLYIWFAIHIYYMNQNIPSIKYI